MIAAMRTILEDILPKMNYDKEKKEKKIVSEEDNLRNFSNLNIDSKNIQDNHNLSFEFYPHISPKLSDNWDFQSQLLGVTFPSDDSENISKWTKETSKKINFRKKNEKSFCFKSMKEVNSNTKKIENKSCISD